MNQGESGSRYLVDLSQNSAVVPPPVPGSDESSLKDPTKSPPSQEGSSDDALADILTKKGGDLQMSPKLLSHVESLQPDIIGILNEKPVRHNSLSSAVRGNSISSEIDELVEKMNKVKNSSSTAHSRAISSASSVDGGFDDASNDASVHGDYRDGSVPYYPVDRPCRFFIEMDELEWAPPEVSFG